MTGIRKVLRGWLAMVVAPGLAACVPFPHHDTVTPRISGRVHVSGTPVQTRVMLEPRAYVDVCAEADRVQAVTDAGGRFGFDAIRAFSLFIAMDPPRPHWRLCIESGGKWYIGWYFDAWADWRRSERLYGPGYHARALEFDCDLAATARLPGPVAPNSGLCRFTGAGSAR